MRTLLRLVPGVCAPYPPGDDAGLRRLSRSTELAPAKAGDAAPPPLRLAGLETGVGPLGGFAADGLRLAAPVGRFAFSPADADASASMKRPSSAPNASSSSSAAPRSAGSGGKSARPFFSPRLRPGEGVGDPKGCWTRCARRASPSSRDRTGECAMPPGLIDTRAAPAISNASASSAAFSDVNRLGAPCLGVRRPTTRGTPPAPFAAADVGVRAGDSRREGGLGGRDGVPRTLPGRLFPRSEGSPNAARLL